MYKKFYFLLFIVLLAGFSVSFAQNTAKETTFYTIERYVCSAELSGLEANTKYIYKIVSEGVESKVHSFVTAGKKGKWNFVALTDFQHKGNNETLPLIKSMKELAQPPLVICSGDMVDVAGKEEGWDWILDNDIFCDFVFAASPGDHEYWADGSGKKYPQYDRAHTFNHLFRFPENGAPMSLNTSYWFRYNNVLFISLDMNNSNVATGPRFDEQVEWFEEAVESLKGTYRYLVVFEHKSIYSSSKIDAVVAARLRPQWAPVFKKCGVDLVLSGHDHIYFRTVQTDGTYYLDMGSSGDKRRALGKLFGRFASTASGGASVPDTTLPIILKAEGNGIMPAVVYFGIVINIVVPFLLILITP